MGRRQAWRQNQPPDPKFNSQEEQSLNAFARGIHPSFPGCAWQRSRMRLLEEFGSPLPLIGA
jgi:hypothetical protein